MKTSKFVDILFETDEQEGLETNLRKGRVNHIFKTQNFQ